MISVAGVMLAAGKASRMGTSGAHKLLAEFDGIPLARRSAAVLCASDVAPVVVITGHRRREIEAVLGGLDLACIFNPDYAQGMGTSLATGIAALDATEADGALVMLADMPGISEENLRLMIGAFRKADGRAIIRAAAGDKRGNPVILPRGMFADLKKLEGDSGARDLIRISGLDIVDVDIGAAACLDVDTPDDIAAAGGVVKG